LTKTERSLKVGITFSIPITTTCTGGTLVTSRAFPSLVIVAMVPVSATPKFAPVMPMSAARNFSLRRLRAKVPRASTSGGIVSPAAPERTLAPEPSLEVHQAAGVARDKGVRPALLQGPYLLVGHGRRDVRHLDREGAPEPAAEPLILPVEEFQAVDVLQ